MALNRDVAIGAIGGVIGALVPIVGAAFFFGGLSKDVQLEKEEIPRITERLDSLRKDAKGEQGLQGPQGLQGVKGEPGLQGIQGLQGTKGDPGPQGSQGLQGVKGEQGKPGSAGSLIIAGRYNGAGLDNLTPNSSLSSSIAGPYVRISFQSYNFKEPPVVMLSPGEGSHLSIHEIRSDYVDVSSQTFEDGRANGYVRTNIPFWFEVVSVPR